MRATRRALSSGSSASTVPEPTATASARARSACTKARAAGLVTQRDSPRAVAMRPSRLAASFSVVKGRPRSTRERKPSWRRAQASASTPTETSMPAARSLRTPSPAVRGSGSIMPITTRRGRAAVAASTQGGVRPKCAHGSSVTYRVEPRAATPARASARSSACGTPPSAVRALASTRRPFATSAPTHGFGAVRPRPRSATRTAARIHAPSASESVTVFGRQIVHGVAEVLDRAEAEIHRHEAQPRDRIERAQLRLHFVADARAGDLALAAVENHALDAHHRLLDRVHRDRALLTRLLNAGDDLQPVEDLAPAVALHDHREEVLDALVGGEAAPALGALAAPALHRGVALIPRVDHLRVRVIAEGAAHRGRPSDWWAVRQREAARELGDLASDLGDAHAVVGAREDVRHPGADALHLRLAHAARGDRRSADAQAAGEPGRARLAGHGALRGGDACPVERVLRLLARDPPLAEVDHE